MNLVNLNNVKTQEIFGKYLGNDIYISDTKYGPAIKYVNKTTVKFFKINEPLTLYTITIDQAIDIIKENIDYPKDIGLYERKKIVLKKNGDSYYIQYDKKNFASAKNNLTLTEAIAIIKSSGKLPLGKFKDNFKECTIIQGKDNKYINIVNLKTKKSYNVPLPDDEDLKVLNMARINEILESKNTSREPLLKLKSEFREYSIFQGKDNKYISVLNLKTKKSYSVPLPDDEDIEGLTTERVNQIIYDKYNKK